MSGRDGEGIPAHHRDLKSQALLTNIGQNQLTFPEGLERPQQAEPTHSSSRKDGLDLVSPPNCQ